MSPDVYIDGFSPGLEPEDSVAATWVVRRAALLTRRGCGKRVQESHLSPGKILKEKAGQWSFFQITLGRDNCRSSPLAWVWCSGFNGLNAALLEFSLLYCSMNKRTLKKEMCQIIEHQAGSDLEDHLVRHFLAKTLSDKTIHHPVLLNLKSVQCQGIHHSPEESIPMANRSHCEQFSSCLYLESSQK